MASELERGVGGSRRRRGGRGALRGIRLDLLGAIALGGAFGAPARYGIGRLVHVEPNGFPWATFWTNVSGSFALGLILILVLERFAPTRWYIRPFLATGFLGAGLCGAYTTFSTFGFETVRLLEEGATAEAFRNALGTLLTGGLAAAVGISLAAL